MNSARSLRVLLFFYWSCGVLSGGGGLAGTFSAGRPREHAEMDARRTCVQVQLSLSLVSTQLLQVRQARGSPRARPLRVKHVVVPSQKVFTAVEKVGPIGSESRASLAARCVGIVDVTGDESREEREGGDDGVDHPRASFFRATANAALAVRSIVERRCKAGTS